MTIPTLTPATLDAMEEADREASPAPWTALDCNDPDESTVVAGADGAMRAFVACRDGRVIALMRTNARALIEIVRDAMKVAENDSETAIEALVRTVERHTKGASDG